MDALVWLYIALYSGFAVWGIREDLRFGAPTWKALLSTVGNALGIGGMIILIEGVVSPEISAVWAWVWPGLLVQAALEARFEYRVRLRRILPEADLEDAQMRSLILTSVVISVLLALPYFWMNYLVAYGTAS